MHDNIVNPESRDRSFGCTKQQSQKISIGFAGAVCGHSIGEEQVRRVYGHLCDAGC